MKKFGDELTEIGIMLFTLAVTVVARGFVFMKFWGWFVVPVFNIITISLFQSLGLILFISLFSKRKMSSKEVDNWEFFTDLLKELQMTAYVFAFGWLIHLCL